MKMQINQSLIVLAAERLNCKQCIIVLLFVVRYVRMAFTKPVIFLCLQCAVIT